MSSQPRFSPTRPGHARARSLVLATALVLPILAAACTAGSSAGPGSTAAAAATKSPSLSITGGNTAPSTTVPVNPPGNGPVQSPTGRSSAPSGTHAPSGAVGLSGTSAATTPTTPAAPPAPKVAVNPADGANSVSPIKPVTASVQGGAFTGVSMRNPAGKPVKGVISADRTLWTSAEPLGYGRQYTLRTTAVSPAGRTTNSTASFTTLAPAETIYPSFFPNPSMKTVGVGQPMVVIFDKPPADKVAAEKSLTVKTVPAVAGSWFWWDERTVHYRPQNYWKPGTRITVSANLYGVALGNGAYGETDRTLTVTIGKSKIARVDDATKQMQVFIDGKRVRTMPVSMGRNKTVKVGGTEISFVTPSGTYVGQEKYAVKQMSSATYGLPVDSSLGYDSKIPLAVRFSNEGIFVHAAPWSVADQGVRNVSHGCINLSPENGRWFYDNFGYGDIMTVTGTSTNLAPTDGYGDWNIAWDKWLAGSALR